VRFAVRMLDEMRQVWKVYLFGMTAAAIAALVVAAAVGLFSSMAVNSWEAVDPTDIARALALVTVILVVGIGVLGVLDVRKALLRWVTRIIGDRRR
jgi:xanthine/uracil permease